VSHYTAGRRAEYRAKQILTAAGYSVTRAAGSKGYADLIAWDSQRIRFVSVKRGSARPSSLEREAFELLAVPPNATKEVWRFLERCREPQIEVL
jgi:Holliday junction resolvase-like predicted endonuclease